MSNIQVLFPQYKELALVNTSSLEDRRSIYPFNISAKKIKIADDATTSEKYPYTLETSNGYTFQVVLNGAELATIQLSDLTGLEIAPSTNAKAKSVLPLLKIFFMDESRQLYTALINQIVNINNNRWFLLLLGLKAKELVKADINTVNLIDAPELQVIKGDDWIRLVVDVIGDISWGYFPKEDRPAIMQRFRDRLLKLAETELVKIMKVNGSALEKAVDHKLKQLAGVEIDIPGINEPATDNLKVIHQVEDLPTEPFLTEDDLKLPTADLAEKIKQTSITAYEAFTAKLNKLKTPSQIRKYVIEKGWLIQSETKKPFTEDDFNLPFDELIAKINAYDENLGTQASKIGAIPQIQALLIEKGLVQ